MPPSLRFSLLPVCFALALTWGTGCHRNTTPSQPGTNNQSVPKSEEAAIRADAAIAAGGARTCALTTTGGVKCWGRNHDTPRAGKRLKPMGLEWVMLRRLGEQEPAVAVITVGDNHTCALTTEGGAKCWGDNTYGQLGRLEPTDVKGLEGGAVADAALQK